MRNKSTIYLTGHFHYYLVSYNTTGVFHSSDEMTECGLPLACCLKCTRYSCQEIRHLFLKKSMYGVTREAIRKAKRKQKNNLKNKQKKKNT